VINNRVPTFTGEGPYRNSSILRHKLNDQERKEPRSADDVLPLQ